MVWQRLPDAPYTAAAGYTVAAIDNAGDIYIYNDGTFATYSIRSARWRQLMPPDTRARCSALAALPGWVYCFSVTTATPAHPDYNNAYVYQVATGRWVAIPPTRPGYAGVAAVVGRDGRIYLMAGGAAGSPFGRALNVYDLHTHTWQERTGLLYWSYALAAAIGLDGRIYAMGGVTEDRTGAISVTNALEVYDPHTNHWAALAPMPTARAGLAAVTGQDGRIYAIGGTSDPINFLPRNGITRPRALATVEVYDPRTNHWSSGPSLGVARWGLEAVAAPDGRITRSVASTATVGSSARWRRTRCQRVLDAGEPGAWGAPAAHPGAHRSSA
jgi:N-acetylneuraminic acid mutarotase